MHRLLSIFISILFLYSSIAWAVPQFYLRQQAAIERDVLSNQPQPNRFLVSDPELVSLIQSFGSSRLPLIIIGPHPDDIEEGTAGFQCALTRMGHRNIHWIILTTGADPTGILDEQIEGYESLSPSELMIKKTELRQNETKAAAKKIGVPLGQITFFGFGAGSREEDFNKTMGLPQQEEFIRRLEEITQGLPPGDPVAIAWHLSEDAHPAHTYATKFLNMAIARFIEETSRPVHALRFRLLKGDPNKEESNFYLLMDDEEAGRKEQVLACHQSQIQRRRLQGRDKTEGTMVDESARKDKTNVQFAMAQFPDKDLSGFSRAERFKVVQIKPGVRIGIDGELYNDVEVKVDPIKKQESDKRLTQLKQEIAITGRSIVVTEGPVAGARWLLEELIKRSNCSDPEFSANMPPHLREMRGIISMLTPTPSPELLIASMLHDGDRFFDGYYVMIEDEPPAYSNLYRQYYKPIQHPRMAADFMRPLLELLGIDEDIIQRVDILIRNHETGIAVGMADSELVTDSGFLRDADSISMFTPDLLVNALVDYRNKGREDEFYHEVYQKYTRCSPQARVVIDRLMKERREEYLGAQDEVRHTAYKVFMKVKFEVASEGGRVFSSNLMVNQILSQI